MKSFKSYLKIQQQSVPWVIPNLYIQHGSHAFTEEDKKETENVEGIPASSVQVQEERKTQVYSHAHHYYAINHNSHLGPHLDDVSQHLHGLQNQKESLDDMPSHEKEAVREYTVRSKDLNMALINHNGNVKKAQKDNPNINIEHLDSIVNKHSLPKMVLHSGVGFHPLKKTAQSNGVFKSSAFISASTDSGTANFFAKSQWNEKRDDFDKHVLRIHVPEGHKGLYIGNGHEDSPLTSMSEYETILPRDTHFKMTRTTPAATYHNGDEVTHVWDAHIVPHGVDPHSWEPPKK